ncbi:zinc ribbon domain-containing protein [Nonomuraea lactucae]|uniref:zinc ribbon domain-containing protein n=1 Tax=Nonomuraea lactucae TaxID=2249762 RepID=UPI0023DD47EC|nr:zinc ribbon domain-containing protein [Nonomuraea lactucae]
MRPLRAPRTGEPRHPGRVRARENRVTQAEFACTACGHTAHADINAATNILRAGLALRRAAEAA